MTTFTASANTITWGPARAILADPTASRWLKEALLAAWSRDPCDAAADAAYLARILDEWSRHITSL